MGTGEPLRILVVDDETQSRELLCKVLAGEGYAVSAAPSAGEALRRLEQEVVDLTFTDWRMPDGDGLEILRSLEQKRGDALAVVVTGHGDLDTAVSALRGGAYDFLTKPVRLDELRHCAERACRELERRRNGAATPPTAGRAGSRRGGSRALIGKSACMRELAEMVERVARSGSTVLIRGESGTGKELVARRLHELAPRAAGPLVPVNCGAIPEELLESELFGHVRGAFTGAIASRSGRFELADGGTIFLDEIGDMSPKLQVKLLRVLQEQEIEPVGSGQTQRVDVRVVAATNVDLERAVEARRFREDLYYRLNVVPIEVPPLRRRPEDIPLLVKHFVRIYGKDQPRPLQEFDPEAMGILQAFHWPGNVRELENLVERMTILARDEIVRPEDLPPKFRQGPAGPAPAPRRAEPPETTERQPPPPTPQAPSHPDEGVGAEEQQFMMGLGAPPADAQEPTPRPAAPPEMPDTTASLNEQLDRYERRMILAALEKHRGVKSRAAEELGIKRTTLVEKMKKKDIVFDRKKARAQGEGETD